MLERLASFSRLILFDRRGSGMSDRIDPGPLEEQVDDVRSVMRAAGSARATVWAETEGTAMASLFAATHPAFVSGLALFTPMPRVLRADDYPWASDPSTREEFIASVRDTWGEGSYLAFMAPSLSGDPSFRDWCARLERLACGPAGVPAALRRMGENDVRAVLPLIDVPTLVMHRRDNHWVDERHMRYVVDHVPGARELEMPGEDMLVFAGDLDPLLDALEEFVTGSRRSRSTSQRVLSTVLFTDIVDSTRRAAELGDAAWSALLDEHRTIVRQQLARYGGVEVKTLGDGSRGGGLDVRAGVHTGEIDPSGGDVTGIAVHIASRVLGHADPCEVIVSRTVVDLVAGSQLDFEPRGTHELKGVPGDWQLYAASA
jgi:class 3 adenylate cyclase